MQVESLFGSRLTTATLQRREHLVRAKKHANDRFREEDTESVELATRGPTKTMPALHPNLNVAAFNQRYRGRIAYEFDSKSRLTSKERSSVAPFLQWRLEKAREEERTASDSWPPSFLSTLSAHAPRFFRYFGSILACWRSESRWRSSQNLTRDVTHCVGEVRDHAAEAERSKQVK